MKDAKQHRKDAKAIAAKLNQLRKARAKREAGYGTRTDRRIADAPGGS